MRPLIVTGAAIMVVTALVIRQNLTKPTVGLVLTSAQITAIEAATTAVKANPSDTIAHWKLVGLLQAVGNEAALATEYITLIRLEPEKPDAIIGMGELLLKNQRYDEALDAFLADCAKQDDCPLPKNKQEAISKIIALFEMAAINPFSVNLITFFILINILSHI